MNAFLVDGIRTPVGSFGGSLAPVRGDDLAAFVLKTLLERNPGVPPQAIRDVILGCVNQAGDDNRNVARMALLLAGLPVTVPGETVNRLCASGMSALVSAARVLDGGDATLMVAGGVEHMTRGPWVISKTSKPFGTDAKMFDSSFGWRFINPLMEKMYGTEAMGMTAENLADEYGISREDQDAFAWRSQQKASLARESGRLAQEIAAVQIPLGKGQFQMLEHDEFIKPQTTLEKLATLAPAFRKEGGTVTAGNASGLNDGAAAVLLASEQGLRDHQLTPIARVVASAVVGVPPRTMGIGPVPATQAALAKAGLTLDQMDVIELNEAFAAQSLACIRALGLEDQDPRINPNGGAIAIGHPLGMSGTRITWSAALELKQRGGRYALATMCIGVGQGYAVILERV
jgi:3-oxoadipyl-CoA thiolase